MKRRQTKIKKKAESFAKVQEERIKNVINERVYKKYITIIKKEYINKYNNVKNNAKKDGGLIVTVIIILLIFIIILFIK